MPSICLIKQIHSVFLGKADIAITAIDKAIELDPQNALYWYLKGNALEFLEKWEEALNAYDQAAELDPSEALYWSHEGTALEALGRTSEAEIALAKAMGLGYTG
jgi:Flp pilus assembly protein TadD